MNEPVTRRLSRRTQKPLGVESAEALDGLILMRPYAPMWVCRWTPALCAVETALVPVPASRVKAAVAALS